MASTEGVCIWSGCVRCCLETWEKDKDEWDEMR